MANKSNKVEKELLRVIKESSKIKLPEEFSDMILMPFEISLMRGDFTKIQYDVILSLLSNLRDKFRDVIETKKKIDELQQLGKDGLNEQQEKPSDTVTQIFFDESKKEDFKKLTIPQQKRSIVREYVQLELFADELQVVLVRIPFEIFNGPGRRVELPLGISQEHVQPHASARITLEGSPLVTGEHHLVQVHVADVDIHPAGIGVCRLRHGQLQGVAPLLLQGDGLRRDFLFK